MLEIMKLSNHNTNIPIPNYFTIFFKNLEHIKVELDKNNYFNMKNEKYI